MLTNEIVEILDEVVFSEQRGGEAQLAPRVSHRHAATESTGRHHMHLIHNDETPDRDNKEKKE